MQKSIVLEHLERFRVNKRKSKNNTRQFNYDIMQILIFFYMTIKIVLKLQCSLKFQLISESVIENTTLE